MVYVPYSAMYVSYSAMYVPYSATYVPYSAMYVTYTYVHIRMCHVCVCLTVIEEGITEHSENHHPLHKSSVKYEAHFNGMLTTGYVH